jgi:hypothetical protein
MPKGQKEFVSNNWFFYYCYVNGTRRQFQLEDDFKKYMKRHGKSCKCKGIYIPAEEDELTTGKLELNIIK